MRQEEEQQLQQIRCAEVAQSLANRKLAQLQLGTIAAGLAETERELAVLQREAAEADMLLPSSSGGSVHVLSPCACCCPGCQVLIPRSACMHGMPIL